MTARVPTSAELLEAARVSPDGVTEWETAFHEAGHVVVEVALGSYPDAVWLNTDGARGDDHAGRTTSRSFLGGELWAHAPDDVDEDLARVLEAKARREAEVLFAGELARELALGFDVDTCESVMAVTEWDDGGHETTDTARLHSLVRHLTAGEAEAWLEDRATSALEVLRRCWPDVEVLASLLVEHRHLDREDLWEALDGGVAEGMSSERF